MTTKPPISFPLHTGAVLLLALLVSACSKDEDSSTTGATGSVITVTGKVIDASGYPIANTPVVVSGRPATTSDANGTFTVTDVTTPYDVTAIYSPTKTAMVYKGITRTDPTIYFTGSVITPPNSATVSGTVSGGAGYPLPASHTSRAMFVAQDITRTATPNGTTGAYTMGVVWTGATTITGTVHALQYQFDASGIPSTYKGYGTKDNVTLTSGGTFAAQNVALSTVTAATVSGSIVVPAGLTLGTKSIGIAFNTAGDIGLGSESTAATAFSYPVPQLTGVSAVLTVVAASASLGSTNLVQRTAPGSSGLTLSLVAPPQPSLPVAAATNVAVTTPFSWTTVSGGVYVLILNGGGTDPDYYVVTTSATGTIPDLSAQGLGLPLNKPYSWQVLSFGPFADMNAVTGPRGLFPATYEGWRAFSTNRTFTTAP